MFDILIVCSDTYLLSFSLCDYIYPCLHLLPDWRHDVIFSHFLSHTCTNFNLICNRKFTQIQWPSKICHAECGFVIWFHLQCVLTTLYRPHFRYLTFTCNINATKNIKTFINDLDFHNKILETQYLSNKLLECTVSCHSPCSFIVKHVPVQFNHSCSSFSIIQNTWPRPIKSRQMWNPTPDNKPLLLVYENIFAFKSNIISNTWHRKIKNHQIWTPSPDTNQCSWYMKKQSFSEKL